MNPGYILVIFCCVLLSGFFSGAETGAISCSRIRMRHLAESGDRRGRIVEAWLAAPERLLALTLVGTNVFKITAATIATYVMIQVFGEHRAEWMSTLVMSLITLVLGDVIPKTLFQQRADTLTLWAAPLLKLFSVLLAPLVFVIARLSELMLRIVGAEGEQRDFFLTREELQALVGESRRAGAVDSERERMIQEILDLRHTIVRDVMIPLVRIPNIDRRTTAQDALPLVAETEQPGVLVFDGSPDRILGMLFPAQLLDVRGTLSVGDLVEPMIQVRDMDRVDQVLERLQQSWHHLALVTDRRGNYVGLATLEDAVAEIVGEIEEDVGRY